VKARAIAAAIVTASLVAPAAATDHLPYPAYSSCTERFIEGPISSSCPFEYGGRRVTVFGAGTAWGEPMSITLEIVLREGPDEQVLFVCSAPATGAGPLSAPAAQCVRRSPVLQVAPGTMLRCRHRGPGTGVFGCSSP